jgi:hypothetical protein
LLFIGLAIFSFFIARGAVAIRYRIYKDKVWNVHASWLS